MTSAEIYRYAEIFRQFSAMSKADKIRAPAFVLALLDMDALDLVTMTPYIDPEGRYQMKSYQGMERFDPTPSYRSRVLEGKKMVTLSNCSEHRMNYYTGILHAENDFMAISPCMATLLPDPFLSSVGPILFIAEFF